MSSPFAGPVLLAEQPFLRYLKLLDDGLEAGQVALTADEPHGIWSLEILDPEAFEVAEDDLDELADFADALSQLILFAGNEAPDDVLVRWAKTMEVDADLVIERVNLIRHNMPHLGRLWEEKTHAHMPILAGVFAEAIRFDGSPRGLLKIAAVENRHTVVTEGTRQSVTIEVWPDDLARLIVEMETLRYAIMNSDDRTGEGEDKR